MGQGLLRRSLALIATVFSLFSPAVDATVTGSCANNACVLNFSPSLNFGEVWAARSCPTSTFADVPGKIKGPWGLYVFGPTFTWNYTATDGIAPGGNFCFFASTNGFSSTGWDAGWAILNVPPYGGLSPPIVSLTSPVSGAVYTAPATIFLSANASSPNSGGSISKVEFYNGASLLTTALGSPPYAFNWTNVGAGTYSLTAKAYDNRSVTTTSAAASVTVNSAGNASPTVSLTVTPSTGLIAPATVTLNATASDSDGTIARVEFYGDGVLINTDTTSPYSFVWSAIGAATHTASARAYDNLGAPSNLASQSFTVSAAPAGNVADGSFELPVLAAGTYVAASGSTIAGSPWMFGGTTGSRGISTNGSAFTAQTVATTNGNQVGFIQGAGTLSQVVNFTTAGNYQISLKAIQRKENQDPSGITLSIEVDGALKWSGIPGNVAYTTFTTPTMALAAGNHTILIRGTNPAGNDNTIFVDLVSVTSVNQPPSVSLTVTPSTGLIAPATVTLNATASDSDGSIAKVEFYGDGVLINTDTTSPYSFVWGGLAAGTHTVSAQAYDNLNAVAATSQMFTVSAAPVNNVADGSFELPVLAAGTYVAASGSTIAGSPWMFAGTTGSRGISTNGSLFTSQTVPTVNGNQVGFIQGAGTLSQVVNFTTAGNYQISLKAIQRKENQDPSGITLSIEVDGALKWSGIPGNVAYTTFTTPTMALAAGNHTILIRGTNPAGNDNTIFVDLVSVAPANVAPTVSLTVTPTTGLVAPATVTLNATASDSDGSIAKVEFYGDGVLINADTTSPYSFVWSGLAAGTHTASAKAYDNLNAPSTLASQSITVNAAPVGNVADGSFELPALAAGTYVAAFGSTIAGSPWTFAGTTGSRGISTNGSLFTAQTVATTDGKQVAFIQGDGNVSQVINLAAGNYQVSLKAIQRKENQDVGGVTLSILVDGIVRWSGVPNNVAYSNFATPALALGAGNHTIQIQGTNSVAGHDNTVFVDVVNVGPPNLPPTVSLTVTPNTGLVAPATVTLSATASDSDGSITKVEFYGDGVLLSTDTTSPYSFVWSGLAAGTHAAMAKAYDNLGASTTASQTITVTPPNVPPTVSLTVTPSTGLIAPATVTLNATASDSDGTIARVEFYGDGLLINSDTTGPSYSFMWSGLAAGTHTASAKAFDNLGAPSTLASQSFTVSAGLAADGSFELPVLAAGTYVAASGSTIAGSPWIFAGTTGSRGISTNGSLFTSQTVPTTNGNQVGFIQGAGTLSQVVTITTAGNYQVSLKAIQRKENQDPSGITLSIEVDGVLKWSGIPGNVAYTTFTTPAMALTAGNHTILIRGTNPAGNDNTIFVDAVSVGSNLLPTVSLTVTPNTGLVAPATVTLSATASDSDGIAKVEFYGDSVLINTDTTSPYSFVWSGLAAGMHTATAQAYDNLNAVAATSQAFTVNSSGGSVGDSDLVCTTPVTTSSVGATPGTFGVSDTGAATYSIPIQVPPGTTGMQPNITLSYSSQGRSGHIGAGWGVTGLSMIGRCAATEAQDGKRIAINYDIDSTNDAYCLDGQRLVAIAQSFNSVEYRTEIESYSKIVRYDDGVNVKGPGRWRVWTKSGQILDYGSRWWILSLGWFQRLYDGNRDKSVKVWALDRAMDRNGNYMEIDYDGTNGAVQISAASRPVGFNAVVTPPGSFPDVEFWPTAIRYYSVHSSAVTDPGYNEVIFNYSDRSTVAPRDVQRFYDQGAGATTLTKKLDSIRVTVDKSSSTAGTVTRSYFMSYAESPVTNRMLLQTVQECAGDGTCLPDTTFAWSGSVSDLAWFQGTGSSSAVTAVNADASSVRIADLNGDGKSDMIRYVGTSGLSNEWEVCLGPLGNCTKYPINSFGDNGDTSRWEVADTVGDGKARLLTWDVSTKTWRVCLFNGSGFDTCQTWSGPILYRTNSEWNEFFWGDFDGDGKIDILSKTNTGHQLINGAYYNFWDMCFATGNITTGTGFNCVRDIKIPENTATGNLRDRVLIADVNGDGRADYLEKSDQDPTHDQWRICLSKFDQADTSKGFDCPAQYTGGIKGDFERAVILDVNGDGLADMVTLLDKSTVASTEACKLDRNSGCWQVCIATGDGGFEYTNPALHWTAAGLVNANGVQVDPLTEPRCRIWKGQNTGSFKDVLYGDFNGDGRTDTTAWDSSSRTFVVCYSTGSSFNCVAQFNNFPSWPNAGNNHPASEFSTGDFNGDGKTDIAIRSSSKSNSWVLGMASDTFADQLKTITTGLGATTKVSYAPITNSSVYVKGNPAQQSLQPRELVIQSPLYVVQETRASNAVGGDFVSTYYYEGLKGRTDGRGLEGFFRRRMLDGNGIVTEMESHQVWPLSGRPMRLSKWAPKDGVRANPATILPSSLLDVPNANFVLVNAATQAWQARPYGIGSPYQGLTIANVPQPTAFARTIQQVHQIETREQSFEYPNGPALPLPETVTTIDINRIDIFGSVGFISVSTFDPAENGTYLKETTNAYAAADTANWILGRISRADVRSVKASGETAFRASSWTYGSTQPNLATPYDGVCWWGLVCKEVIEPDYAADTVNYGLWHETAYVYDRYGNRQSATVRFQERDSTGAVAVKTRAMTTNYVNGDTATTNRGRFALAITNAVGHAESRVYDNRYGAIAVVNGPNGLSTSTLYDGLGRRVCEASFDAANATGHRLSQAEVLIQSCASADPSYAAASTCQAQESYRVRTKASGGGWGYSFFDNLQRERRGVVKAFNANAWAEAATTYDALGRKATVRKPAGAGTVTAQPTYDVLNRVISELTTGNDGSGTRTTTASTVYGAMTTTVTRTNPSGSGQQINSRTVNSQGLTTSTVDANGKSTMFVYDAFGNLKQVNGPTGIAVAMTYDKRGRKVTMTDPDMGFDQFAVTTKNWQYAYNGAGELIWQRDAKNQEIRLIYDVLGRMIERREYSGVETGVLNVGTLWTYDSCAVGKGKLCSMESHSAAPYSASNLTHKQSIAYDGAARPSTSTSTIGASIFASTTQYDNNSRVAQVQYPTGLVVKQSYTAWGGHLDTITDTGGATTYWRATSRYLDGQVSSMQIGSHTTTRTYDPLGRVKTVATAGVQNANYTFDEIGNLTGRGDPLVGQATETYAYDLVNRLVAANGITIAAYDAAGNITSRAGTGTYTYWAGTHRLKTLGGPDYNYDANGNLTGGGNRAVTLTPFNMPSRITGGGGTLDYVYDGNHARVVETSTSSGTTFFVGNQFYEEQRRTDGSVYRRHFINSPEGPIALVLQRSRPGFVDDTLTRYWHKDHLGSLGAVTNESGTIVERFTYDVWGRRTAPYVGTGEPLEERGFTGHETLDDVAVAGIGLVHMNGRIYDPFTGRFMSADPLVQDLYNIQSYNRYSYTLNNPLSFTDPTGFSWWTKWRKPIIAVIAAIATYGIASAWMAAAALEAGGSTFFAAVADFQYGATIATLTTEGSAVAGAAAGFAAGGIMGGNLESATYGALTGAIAGYVAGYFANSWTLSRVGVQTATSAASAYLTGGDWRRAAQVALIVSVLSYGNVALRELTIESSSRFAGICASDNFCVTNLSGSSEGMLGDNLKVGGGRLNLELICKGQFTCIESDTGVWRFSGDGDQLREVLRGQESPLGGVQGGTGKFINIPYAPGSVLDRVVESFSGPHDFFNSWYWYDKLGNAMNYTGMDKVFGEILNGFNVLPGAPFAIAINIPVGAYDALAIRPRRR